MNQQFVMLNQTPEPTREISIDLTLVKDAEGSQNPEKQPMLTVGKHSNGKSRMKQAIGAGPTTNSASQSDPTVKAFSLFFGTALCWFLALSFPAAGSAAESTTNQAGHWEGAIELPGSPIAIRVDLDRGADQTWNGWIDIPGQRGYGLKLAALNVDGSAVSFEVPAIPGGARFAGQLAENGRTLAGEYTQMGQKLPFKLERDRWTMTLLRAHGDYLLVTGSAKDPWIEFSLPFPFEGQTPLQVSLTTDPPGRVERTEIISDEENRFVRIHLQPDTKGATESSKQRPGGEADRKGTPISIRMEALVVVRDRPLCPLDQTPVPRRAELPPEVAQYFASTPGVDPAYSGIVAVAKSLPTTSMGGVIVGVNGWLLQNIRNEPGGDQGAVACFEAKKAVCTGYANLAASLFQAAGVPCRVLGCLNGKRVQEHFIVEVWAPGMGWWRVDPPGFPVPDSRELILHVAYPTFPRNEIQMAYHLRGAQGCLANFKKGADTAWQGMDILGVYGLAAEEADALEAGARNAFAGWEKTPAKTATLRLAPPRASFPKPSPSLATLLGQLDPDKN
ncbi:MAG: transglutaminase-like domain-containing protein [Limisphaerales bacterium]